MGVPEGTDYIVWADDVENTFEAYYPVVEGKTDSYTQFELPTNQSSNTPGAANYIGHADYMTAAASQSKSDALNLTFKHHLAKVTVEISGYGDQYATQKPVFQTPTFTVPTTKTYSARTLQQKPNTASPPSCCRASMLLMIRLSN